MATPNQTPLSASPDPAKLLQPLAQLPALRAIEPAAVPALSPTMSDDAMLAARAEACAQSCTSVEKSSDLTVLDAAWAAADAAIRAASARLDQETRNGLKVTANNAKWFITNGGLIRAALQETAKQLSAAARLPQVRNLNAEIVPRAYAAVEGFLNAVQGQFEKNRFTAFLHGFQRGLPLQLPELWTLQTFTQLVLLQGIGALAPGLQSADEADSEAPAAAGASSMAAGSGISAATLPQLIVSLRELTDLEWEKLFEDVSETDKLLRQDPLGMYSRMDFESRAAYRNSVAELSAHSEWTEQQIVEKALILARAPHHASTQRGQDRRSHVGYYIVDDGKKILREAIGYQPSKLTRIRDAVLRGPDFFYLVGIEISAFAVLTLVTLISHVRLPGFAVLALFLLPAMDCGVSVINLLVTLLLPPKKPLKLDFAKGIPEESATMVVIPTLLIAEEQAREAAKALEIRYLGNRDANLHFALLTDPPDSTQEFDDKDALAGFCSQLIEELNLKYASGGQGTFFHFHRNRLFNEAEGIWMGWERKRGKLVEFNNLLLGRSDSFPVKVGDLSILPKIKYVITLDADTQLPRDAARKLVGAIAHPLNVPVVDPVSHVVVEGHAILQPRVDISASSARSSRLAAILSGDTGFDIYTRAISDVYQDLFGEGIFTGKGIYEVEPFQSVLDYRFPSNRVLSHDLIEGSYSRAGLVSDVELIDDYPSQVSAYSRRKHRWIRGDWQIAAWLMPRVRNYFGDSVRNPLNAISRWKIFDNLRRSITDFAILALLLCGWLALPDQAVYWTLAALAIVAFPTFFQFVPSLLRAGGSLFTRAFWKNFWPDFLTAQAHLLFRLTFLCHQSLVTMDAVLRSIGRMIITHKKLLEWETAAEAELNSGHQSVVELYLDWTPAFSLLIAVVVAASHPSSLAVALPLLALWAASPAIVHWLNQPVPERTTEMSPEQTAMLRDSVLRTWRFFRELSTAEENWLIPDLVQQAPKVILHHVSTTNLGFLLNARQSAQDFGWLTLPEFVTDTERTLQTAQRLKRVKGHFYNWYHTQTLEPIEPLFVSTVDNGNLVCSLWTLQRGCLEAAKQPLFPASLAQGVLDHLEMLESLLGDGAGHPALFSLIRAMKTRAAALDFSRPEWFGAASDLETQAVAFEKKVAVSANVPEDLAWWAHELSMRLSNLERMVYDFTPWRLPPFAKFCGADDAGAQDAINTAQLTLASLPAMQAALNERLEKLISARDIELQTRSGLRFFRSALERAVSITRDLTARMEQIAGVAHTLADEMDFALLYNPEKRLIAIGYDGAKEEVSKYHYDLLASEARAAVFVGVAKGELPQESWFRLDRSHILYKHSRVLRSWTGTMFEYLMPTLWMKSYPRTLLEQSGRAAVSAQQKYAAQKSIPWGISESSCSEMNPDGVHRYFAFGVPALAMNRDAADELVVSPYSTFLSLGVDLPSSLQNLERMKGLGWLGKYGFYEAADFTPSRVSEGNQYDIVPCWMAHHQGMSLVAATNALCENSMQRRFHDEPRVQATARLLLEKFPRVPVVEPGHEGVAAASALLQLGRRMLTRPQIWGAGSKVRTPA
jgi:cyclic beta-1,2-glucan synthetase